MMANNNDQQRRAGILIFDDVEVLDFCGPFEVLSVARLDEARRSETDSPYDVRLVAQQSRPIVTRGGMTVLPANDFADCPPLDLLIVPGGWGTRALIEDGDLHEWLRARAAEVSTLASVCTGAMLLGHAGLLHGRRATTHWRALDWMRDTLPDVTVVDDEHVVTDGHVLTSAGISAGIDMALELLRRDHGETVARNTARQMEYRYHPNDNRRRIAL